MLIKEKIICDFEKKDHNIDIVENCGSNIYYVYLIANHVCKRVNVCIKHINNKSEVSVVVNCIALHGGKIDIRISNTVDKKISNCSIQQDINGIVLDDKSSITALPIMNISNNSVKASHSVSIGKVNNDDLFYLLSRGYKKVEAINFIISKLFSKTTENYLNFLR
ncbi:MAG: hypothetical protein Ta2E_05500 [Mycoplasmoidaceae bacterium]|nr:MAG: hypothetical protein Ta2E_05500 [Mycoplasmoidaceae bacterium]